MKVALSAQALLISFDGFLMHEVNISLQLQKHPVILIHYPCSTKITLNNSYRWSWCPSLDLSTSTSPFLLSVSFSSGTTYTSICSKTCETNALWPINLSSAWAIGEQGNKSRQLRSRQSLFLASVQHWIAKSWKSSAWLWHSVPRLR